MQQKRVGVKATVVIGLACALGIGWALGSPRVLDVQELQPEIPLYEGAQIEWEVQLTAQEMGAQLAQWAQELSVLKIAGYTIAGERALEVLNFYDQALSQWRRVFWAQPSESGGARIFAHEQSYLFIGISKKYEATELILATGQTDETTLDVPIFEGAELQWEILLTKQDLLEHLKRWLGDLVANPPSLLRMQMGWQPERPEGSLIEAMSWLGVFGFEALFRLLQDFSDVRVVGYQLEGNKALDALSFYEQQFREWTRNFWAKPEESGGIRIFSQGSADGLRELALVISGRALALPEEVTNVIVLRAWR